MKPIKLLWVSDSPRRTTGLGCTSRELLTRLAAMETPRFDITCYAEFDQTATGSGQDIHFRLVPGDNHYGQETLPALIREFNPDFLVTCGDIWMTDWLADQPEIERVRWINFCMPDGLGFPSNWIQTLLLCDHVVVPSLFGASQIFHQTPDMSVSVVPLGVDTTVFHPLNEKRTAYNPSLTEDHFVVGCVARNQFRKQLPQLIKAFARFKTTHENAVLYLHTDPADEAGWNLSELIKRYGLQNHIGVTRGCNVGQGVSQKQLCQIYNTFDLFVLPTMGEAFGLPFIEAMACGVPVVGTECSAVTELVKEGGETIRVKEWLTLCPTCIDHAIADSDHLLEIMQSLYDDPSRRTTLGARGREFAQKFTWDSAALQWVTLLSSPSLLGREKKRKTETYTEPVISDGPGASENKLPYRHGTCVQVASYTDVIS